MPSDAPNSTLKGSVETQSGRAPGKRRSLRRWLRRGAIFVGASSVLFLALYFTRERTLHPLLVRVVPPLARSLAGWDLRLTDIDGDWRKELTLEGLSLQPMPKHAGTRVLQSLRIERATVQGRLLSLVRSSGELQFLNRVHLEAPELLLDMTAPTGPRDEDDGGEIAHPTLPQIEVWNGSVTIKLTGDTLRIRDLELSGGSQAISPLAVNGRVEANDWRTDVVGRVYQQPGNVVAFHARLVGGQARGIAMGADELQGSWSPGETRIQTGTVVIGDNQLTAADVVLRQGVGGIEVGGQVGFDLNDAENAHRAVYALMGENPTGGWSGSASGTVDLTPAPGHVATGSVTLEGTELVVGGVRLGTVAAKATASEQGIDVQELTADSGSGSRLSGSGTYLFKGPGGAPGLKGATAELQWDPAQELAPGLPTFRALHASLRLEGPLNAPDGAVDVTAESIQTGGLEFQAVSAKGELAAGVLELPDFGVTTPFGRATGGARVGLPLAGKPLDVLLRTFALEQKGATLKLAQAVPIQLDGGAVRIDDLRLRSGDGFLDLSLDTAGPDGLALDLSASGLELEPFLGESGQGAGLAFGALGGSATYSSNPPRANVDLTLARSARGDAAPVSARLRAEWSGERVELREVLVELQAAQLQLAGSVPLTAAAMPLGDGPVDLQAKLSIDARALTQEPLVSLLPATLAAGQPDGTRGLSDRAEGRVFADLQLGGAWNALTGSATVTLENASVAPPSAGAPSFLPAPLSGRLQLDLGDTITLAPSNLRLGRVAKIQTEGSLDQALDATALWVDPAARLDQWKSRSLDARADIDFSSLDWLARFLPELRETGGELIGAFVAEGTLGSPEPRGTLTMTGGTARYRGFPPLENGEVTVTLEPNQIVIERADMEIGAAPISIAGNILRGQGAPRIDATIKGTEVLLARSADARIRANLDLVLNGRTNDMLIGGTVDVVDGRLRSPIEFQNLLAGGGESRQAVRRGIQIPAFGPETVKLDVTLRTVEPLGLKGRIARGDIRADLEILGTAAHPTPIGRVFFDPLELAVPAGTISFPTGLITFEPEAPDIPRIDLVGTTRLAGYDVTVNVEGDFDEPDVELSSSPPLAPEDLLLLVLSGQPPARGGGIEAAGQSVALYVAKDLVRGWFSSGSFENEDKESFLDRLEVTTGRDVSHSGTLTLEATYKLREGLARKRDALYVVLERDSYEDYGLGLRLVLRLR